MSTNWFRHTIQWLLYSNLYIGIAAFGCLQVTRITFPSTIHLPFGYDLGLLFGTISLYAFHRFVGITRIPNHQLVGRFGVISKYRTHLWYYGVFTLLVAGICVISTLGWLDLIYLLPAGIISLLYITPIFPNSARLRDLPIIKVFLIALIWAWLVAGFPLLDAPLDRDFKMAFTLDRFLFVLAITLPFDIRDLSVDKIEGTLTIPQWLGTRATKMLSLVCLGFGLLIVANLFKKSAIDLSYLMSTLMTYIIAGFLVIKSNEKNSDFYYSGWMDGLLILQWLLMLITQQLF